MTGFNDNLRRIKSKFTHGRRLSRSHDGSNGTTHTAEDTGVSDSTGIDPVVVPPTVTQSTAGSVMTIPQISIQSVEGPSKVSSPDIMKGIVESGVYDKVLAGTEKKAGGKFHKILENVNVTMEAANAVTEGAGPFRELLSSNFVADIEAKVSSFAENIPWLMNVLDEVTALHPAIQVVALAFKAAYHIEMTRRENDKRIRTLYVEMKEMIYVLIQLRDVKDPDARDPYGRPLSDRLEHVSQKAAVDIKDCANVCDTFSRKGPLIRILKGNVWEVRLIAFIKRFDKRRSEFQQALTVHTALVVDSIEQAVKVIDARLDIITKLFHQYTPPDEVKLAKSIEEKGKDLRTIQNNEKDLRDLIEMESNLDSDPPDPKKGIDRKHGGGKGRGMKRLPLTVKELRDELHEGLDESIQKNLTFFEGKFMLYHRQMHESLLKVMQENHSQLLIAMQGGPHERIVNKELRKIWHDMNWRRNVKSRLFVMTLRDHFQDKLLETKLTARKIKVFKAIEDDRASRISFASRTAEEQLPVTAADQRSEDDISVDSLDAAKDDWAYHYISLAWLQPIMEAFDDDGSGYITVTEVNRFTETMPKDLKWTLQHWIAYWAIGWQISAAHYRSKILNLFADMFQMLPQLRPANRYWADYYLGKVWPYVVQLLFGLQTEDLPDLQHKFQLYINLEEARIKTNLEDIKYNVDSTDLASRVGGERVEKHVLPLVYLLMKRDFEIFQVAQHKVIHVDELWDAVDNLLYVFSAIETRVQDLTAVFSQQQVDITSRMETMAAGLLRYYYNSEGLWSMSNLWYPKFDYYEGDIGESIETDDISALQRVLRYPLRDEPSVDTSVFISGYEYEDKMPSELDLKATYPLANLLGRWTGYQYDYNIFPVQALREFYIHAVSLEGRTFEADGRDFDGAVWHMAGQCAVNNQRQIEVTFSVHWTTSNDAEYFQGWIDETDALVGSMGWSEGSSVMQFIFKRLPADVMIFYPSPAERQNNLVRSRWNFALQCTLRDVRRKMWSWSYFAERRERRKRYIQLNIAYWWYGKEPYGEEFDEFIRRRRSLTPSEACLCRDIRDRLLEILPRHDNVCAGCFRQLGGVRIMCLDCQPEARQLWDTIDFCGHPDCNRWILLYDTDKPHRPTHDIVKLRTVLHRRDMPHLDRFAKTALARARSIWRPTSLSPPPSPLPTEMLEGPVYPEHRGLPDSVDRPLQETSSEHILQLATEAPLPPSVLSSPISEASGHFGPISTQLRSACYVCREELLDPCWYCVTCSEDPFMRDFFICDTCEAELLLPCNNCSKPFVQPRYFYGLDSKDTFLCNVCTLKGVSLPVEDKDMRHVYTHTLVRVQDRIEDPVPLPPPTVDQRIIQLEQRVSTIDSKLDRLENRLEELISSQDGLEIRLNRTFSERFSHMENLLAQILNAPPPVANKDEGTSSSSRR